MTEYELKSMPMECGAGVMQRDAGYVYADQLLKAHLDQLISEGWRQCAKGQGTSQFCGQLEAAVKAEREACLALAMQYAKSQRIGVEWAIVDAIRARSNK